MNIKSLQAAKNLHISVLYIRYNNMAGESPSVINYLEATRSKFFEKCVTLGDNFHSYAVHQ